MIKKYLIIATRFAVKETTRKAVKYMFRSVVVAATGVSIVTLTPIMGVYGASLVGTVCGGLVDFGACSIASIAARRADRYVAALLVDPMASGEGNSFTDVDLTFGGSQAEPMIPGMTPNRMPGVTMPRSGPGILHAFGKQPLEDLPRAPVTAQEAVTHFTSRF